jgi:hypothetical protein
VRWVWSTLWSSQDFGPLPNRVKTAGFRLRGRQKRPAPRRSSYGRRAYEQTDVLVGRSSVSKLLTPLAVDDRLPWKLDREGQPLWLVVVELLSPTSYLVQYPDGKTEILVDSE